MIVLDNQQLIDLFPITPSSFQLNGYVSWMDDTSGIISNPGGRVFASSSGSATVTAVVSLPSGGVIRKVKSIAICNWGVAPATLRLYLTDFNKGGAQFDLIRVTLQVYQTLSYGDVEGFRVG